MGADEEVEEDFRPYEALEDYTKIRLRDDEVDMEEGPQNGAEQNTLAGLRQIRKEFGAIKEFVLQVLHDLEDGSLKR